MEVYEDALESMRSNIVAHGSTPWRQEMRAKILTTQGELYNDQYEFQGRGPDKGNCKVAKVLGEEALAINRALNVESGEPAAQVDPILERRHRQELTGKVLLAVARTYVNLGLFKQARITLQEAVDTSSRRHGCESAEVAVCHSRVATLCGQQAEKIMLMSSSLYLPGSRVCVEGLKNHPQYNGLEGTVIRSAIDSRICIRLDQGSEELRLKLENVRTLIGTADERKERYKTILELVAEEIDRNKEGLRIHLKTKGVKHVNTAGAYYNLGIALSRTCRPAETREAVVMLIKAGKIVRRVSAEKDPNVLKYAQALEKAHAAVARFDVAGVLSAMPGWWPPTSQKDDEADMAALFVALQARHDNSDSLTMTSEEMQQGLRTNGLFNFTASSSDSVGRSCCI